MNMIQKKVKKAQEKDQEKKDEYGDINKDFDSHKLFCEQTAVLLL